jgi:YidC/Oxa1 family membrane protein insertase
MPSFLVSLLLPLRQAVAWVLAACHDLATGVGLDPAGGAAWAVAIVGLVVAARLLLVPLVVRQVRAAHALALLQPDLQRVRRRYQGRTDLDSLRAARAEQRAVMRAAGARPAAAFLPALLQAPVLLSLYTVISGIPRHETVGALDAGLVGQADAAHLLGAGLSDTVLSSAGGTAVAVSVALVVVMAAAQALTQWLALRNRPPADADGDLGAAVGSAMRAMVWLLPLTVGFTALHLPLGVVLYWATSALWSAGQQLLVNRFLPHPALARALVREVRR